MIVLTIDGEPREVKRLPPYFGCEYSWDCLDHCPFKDCRATLIQHGTPRYKALKQQAYLNRKERRVTPRYRYHPL